MAISEGYKHNFQTILLAGKNEDLCIMACTDKATGKPVIVLCAAQIIDEMVEMIPLAKLFDGNPYEEVAPPTDFPETEEELKAQLAH